MSARDRVLELARAEGFSVCRVASAEALAGPRGAALAAHDAGRLADMAWMSREWLCRATDPETFLAGARSVVVLALPCHADPPPWEYGDGRARGRVARYARGRDYHRVFEPKLRRMVRAIREELGGRARATVDYGPLLERPLAAHAGLGWLGKSTMLLVPGLGPWVLLGAVATDLELEPDAPLKKSCGSCNRCIVACPTGAISPDGGVLDSRLCISYHTIENRGPIPRELRPLFGDWVFGCDECLDSCPVGRAAPGSHPNLAPCEADDAFPPLADLLALDEVAFATRFRGRAIMRAKRDGLVRNACIALGNVGSAEDIPALLAALADASPLVRGHAAWAIGEMAGRLRLSDSRLSPWLLERLATESDGFVREELEHALQRLADADGEGR